MQKIISLFQRNYEGDHQVRDEVVPGAEWVLAGEGTATEKHDGTCCLVRDGRLYKRYEVKPGKTPPPHFEPANEVDDVTGKQQGWVPVGTGPDDQWHRAAWDYALREQGGIPSDGTYELIGPKVQGNPYGMQIHYLIPHGAIELQMVASSFAAVRGYLSQHAIEGIVWHHPDGRMCKIKRKDFGLPWPVKG